MQLARLTKQPSHRHSPRFSKPRLAECVLLCTVLILRMTLKLYLLDIVGFGVMRQRLLAIGLVTQAMFGKWQVFWVSSVAARQSG